jgi:hypothetical protein
MLAVGIHIRLTILIVCIIDDVDIEFVVTLFTLQNDSSITFVLHMVLEELVKIWTICAIGWL